MSKVIKGEFPFNELVKHTGDKYDFPDEMAAAGFEQTQMWSVAEHVGEDGAEYLMYGPSNHFVNVIYYVATAEHHDDNTYYEVCVKTAQQAACENNYFCETCED